MRREGCRDAVASVSQHIVLRSARFLRAHAVDSHRFFSADHLPTPHIMMRGFYRRIEPRSIQIAPRRASCGPWFETAFGLLTMRSKPLKLLCLILSLSKDEAAYAFSASCQR